MTRATPAASSRPPGPRVAVDRANRTTFARAHAPPLEDKCYDVAYAGSILPGWVSDTMSAIKRHRHVIISHDASPLVTHHRVSYGEKMRLVALSKVAIVHNLLFPSTRHRSMVRSQPRYEKNRAFERLEEGIVPQLKARLFEAALCRTLILCRHDPWNLIERFFEPEREFLYFRSTREMRRIIEDAARSFDRYQCVIESAHRRTLEHYTAQAFLESVVRPSLAVGADPVRR